MGPLYRNMRHHRGHRSRAGPRPKEVRSGQEKEDEGVVWMARKADRSVGFPKFKKKGCRDSCRFSTGAIKALGNRVRSRSAVRAPIGRPCASTWPLRSTAWARASMASPSSCSFCAVSLPTSWSRPPSNSRRGIESRGTDGDRAPRRRRVARRRRASVPPRARRPRGRGHRSRKPSQGNLPQRNRPPSDGLRKLDEPERELERAHASRQLGDRSCTFANPVAEDPHEEATSPE